MVIGKNIRYLRKKANMSQDELAKKLGYKSFTTIQKWETDGAIPTFEKLEKIASIFKVSFYDLTNNDLEKTILPEYSFFNGEQIKRYEDPDLQFEIESTDESLMLLRGETPEDDILEDIKAKFKVIDIPARKRVHDYLNVEYVFKKEILALMDKLRISEWEKEDLEKKITTLEYKINKNKLPTNLQDSLIQLPYYNKLASAGNGDFLFEDLPIKTVDVLKSLSHGADFVIGVDGDSMEPSFNDGDKVLVKKMDSIKEGDIGIFINEEHCYIKQLGKEGLVSLNPKYPIIKGTKDIRCIGKVVGKI